MKMTNSYIKSLKFANHLILTISLPHTTLPCHRQKNHSSKLNLQINCQVSIPAARYRRKRKSRREKLERN